MKPEAITLTDDMISNARILALRGALRLETKGMTRRGRSAYAIIKEEFGFRGNKQSVLDQLNRYIETNILAKPALAKRQAI